MKFDEMDKMMRVYEESLDQYIIPGYRIVVRIDGRCFTRLTKQILKLKTPFDEKMRDYMVETVRHLIDCGFGIMYGFTESDEISLLFRLSDETFGRKTRKLNSILAGEASSVFSLQVGVPVSFDCRVIPLPNAEKVVDYFLWRQEDAHRNALNAYCYWTLRNEKLDERAATKQVSGLSVGEKNELLFARGINFNNIPAWQNGGVGIYRESYQKKGYNPLTGQAGKADRFRLKTEYNLPVKQEYAEFIKTLLMTDAQTCTSRSKINPK
ncbi:tRNA(His) guanylyltransferase Thg1 family protein [Cloacibacillus evryensis]|uniref:tRNA(His) guanylyltransferase n=2 Tax=Cloacibacillus evryensis TaxID=508460 RepID=A0AAW5K799_9BACT|nr:tRNA(His) guanylyltransferase Thg1 family protein [Cloacibacillus evryensis]EHL70957.1 hypothetical protein HMPREF1006_02091 [Synergistes sp. 3_1_syn1]MCQ4814613.1 guanylyltransferase [Cloacibacillus evryensis]